VTGASSRNRGNSFEVAVANFLQAHGWEAITSRNANGGRQHGPDLITDLPVTVEAKNQKRIDLAGWVDQAVEDAGGELASVWVKRRGRGDVGESYVVMRASDFVEVMRGLVPSDEVPF